jgi:hypothetical protein
MMNLLATKEEWERVKKAKIRKQMAKKREVIDCNEVMITMMKINDDYIRGRANENLNLPITKSTLLFLFAADCLVSDDIRLSSEA